MSVNGVSNVSDGSDRYSGYSSAAKKTTESTAADTSQPKNEGVVYEKNTNSTQKYKPNAELIAKLKADADQHTAQFKSLVEKMMTQQGSTLGKADSMWKFLAGGKFTVTPDVKAQAQADIAEDGYWGVNKTSDRIVDFAKALTGGDPDKIETMRKAFEKGFKQATGSWGKDLPDISNRTYSAVMDKFDKWAEEAAEKNSTEVDSN